jgi:hypothetical protein
MSEGSSAFWIAPSIKAVASCSLTYLGARMGGSVRVFCKQHGKMGLNRDREEV